MAGLPDALRAEHAAVFGYGVVGAHLKESLRKSGRDGEEAHRRLRDAVLLRLTEKSASPPAAEPAYTLPFEVTDSDGAVRLALHLEEATAQVWRASLAATRRADRELCLKGLMECAVRATRWRAAADKPPTVAYPGTPQ